MVKRIRNDDSSPKSKKVKSLGSSGKILAVSTAGKKKEKDGDYDPRCDKSLSKKKGKSDLSPIKFSFSRSNPDQQKDTFDRSNFTEQEIKSINLQVLSDYSHLNEVVSNLSDEQKRDIRDIGFGSLLDIRIKKFCPNLNLEVLLNYNASGMMFSTKNGKLIFNKFTISDVLGLPVSDRAVEVIDDDAFRRKGSQIEAGSARKDWHRFLGISDPKKVYIGRKNWDDLFKKYESGDDFKKLFVIFSLSKLLCPIADLGPVLKCAKSLEDVSAISSYDWCGYILRSLCAAVLDCHQSIMIKKIELGQKKVSFKLRGCVSPLTLVVIHNFKCRNLDYSNVSKPFISYWQDEKDLTDVVKQFEINMDFILPVKREKQKVEFKTPSVSVASRKSGSPIIKVVEGPSPSTRQLIMDLPHSLMTDEEIDALDVPEYVKNMHKLKRNALAFCQVNLEIAQNIREEGEKLSQDSISLDDSEVFNPDFLSQIDDICKRHLEAKDSANKVDPTISLLVKRPVELEFGRIENVPDLDSGVHGVDLKEGNDEKEGEEDEKKMNADDDQHKEDDDDDDDYDGDDKDHQNYNERKDDDADDNGDPGLQGDEDKGVDKDAGLHGDEDKGGDNGDPGLQGDEDKVGDKDAGLHGDGEEGGNNEKEPKEDDNKKTGNADDDCGLQGDKEEGGNKDLDAGVHTEGEKGGNVEKEQPKEADRKRRNADDDQVKGAKDKDKCKISTHVPTRTAAGIDIVDLRTPTPPPPPPPVVEAVENVYSRKSWRVDSSAKRKNIADFDAPSFQLLTPSPVVEDLPYSAESGEGVGSSIPIITPVNVKYPRGDGSYSDQSSYKSYKPQKQLKSEIPSTPELLKGWDYDPSSDKVGKVVRVKEPGDDYDDEGLEDLIDRIADQGVESSSHKAKKEEDENEAGVVSSSTPGLHAVPVNNHGIILCRSLQHYNRYLSDLSPDQRLLVDYLFYNEYEDVAYMSLDTDSEEVKMKNDIMQSELTSDLIVDFDNPHSNYAVQLYKFDLISMPRQGWLTSGVIDGCVFMFNRQEEESPSATRRFWFNIMPFNYINWLCAEKVKKVQFESEIAENEIILKNLEGTRQYDQKFKEWEENKKKLITKDDDLFYKKCKEAISSWVKSFPGNDIREAELIFVPVHKDDHYTVLVLNKKAKRIENIDNRTDMKDIDRYKHEEFNGLTYFCRAFDSFMKETMRCRDFDRLHHWQTSTLYFPWRSKDNNFDCGVYAIKTMELYDGQNTNHAALVDLKRAATKNLERCRLALRLVDHPLNKLREKVKHDCYVWSAKKPELMARQKIRKDKEAVLDKLAFNRSKKTNRKEAHILRRRRDHEAKVEDVLNNNFGDKVKIEQLLKFHYC